MNPLRSLRIAALNFLGLKLFFSKFRVKTEFGNCHKLGTVEAALNVFHVGFRNRNAFRRRSENENFNFLDKIHLENGKSS